jgi:threonine dehydratase
METILNLDLIASAQASLSDRILPTPLEHSPVLSELLGQPVWLKLEFLQLTGSFKARGAFFRLSQLSDREKELGVATCSAGNHGKAVAYAARELGIKATVYVPASVDEAKYQGMLSFGAEVIRSDYPGFDDTQAWAIPEIERSGRLFVSAFDDPWIMAGNGGTLAIETLQALPQAEAFLLPVSGGGLAAGFAYYIKETRPSAQIVGCQHRDSPGLALSLERGEAVTALPPANTTAGGLEGGLGRTTFPILKDRIDRVFLASEEELFDAVRWTLQNHQYLVEPSAAVTVAACLSGQIPLDGPAVAVLSGRNVSLETVQKILKG